MMQFTEEQKAALIEFNRAIIKQHESYAVPESDWPDEVRLLVSSARIALGALTAEPEYTRYDCGLTISPLSGTGDKDE